MLPTELMTLIRYKGNGFTTTWTRVFICVVFTVWGLSIALTGFRRTPTRAHAEYKRSIAEAKRDGRDIGSVTRPPEGEMWRDGFPGWTLVGVAITAVGLAALTQPFWRRRRPDATEDGTGQQEDGEGRS